MKLECPQCGNQKDFVEEYNKGRDVEPVCVCQKCGYEDWTRYFDRSYQRKMVEEIGYNGEVFTRRYNGEVFTRRYNGEVFTTRTNVIQPPPPSPPPPPPKEDEFTAIAARATPGRRLVI